MMKLPQPDHLTIGCHTYTVEVGDFEEMMDDGLKGEVNWRLQRMRINSTRPVSGQFVSLLHEVIHTAEYHFLKEDTPMSERVVSALAEGLAQMLQSIGFEIDWQNPPLVGRKEDKDG